MQIQSFTGSITQVPAIPSKSRLDDRPFTCWHNANPTCGDTMSFIDLNSPMTWREILAALSVEQCHVSLEVAVAISKFVMTSGQDDGLRAPRGAANLFPYIDKDGETAVLNACFPSATEPNPLSGINVNHYWYYADESSVLDVRYWFGTRIHIAG